MSTQRIKPGGEWTLLYVRQPGGGNQAIGQIHLHDDVDLQMLLQHTLPSMCADLQKRTSRWKVMIADESLDPFEPGTWANPAANTRYIRAMQAWIIFRNQAYNEPLPRSLELLHDITIETFCSCLMGRPVQITREEIDPRELQEALTLYLQHKQQPSTLRGCRD